MTGFGERDVALEDSDAAPMIDDRIRNSACAIFIVGAFDENAYPNVVRVTMIVCIVVCLVCCEMLSACRGVLYTHPW